MRAAALRPPRRASRVAAFRGARCTALGALLGAWLACAPLAAHASPAAATAAERDAPPVEDAVLDAPPLTRADETWRIAASRSRVEFRVRLFGVVPVAGRFPSIDGAIALDRDGDRARVAADVDARAVRMKRPSHAAWARSPEFFDAEAHPVIRFESEPFPLARLRDGGAIQGALTVRGVTRPAAFTVENARCAAAFDDASAGVARFCRVELAGAIDRSQFGMRTRGGTLANRVSLRFHIEAGPTR